MFNTLEGTEDQCHPEIGSLKLALSSFSFAYPGGLAWVSKYWTA
jgi:hypothetical protein